MEGTPGNENLAKRLQRENEAFLAEGIEKAREGHIDVDATPPDEGDGTLKIPPTLQ